jgi:hypothetical protein
MYKLIFLFLVCCLLSNGYILAQTKDETTIATRMETLRNALLKPDKATLANIAADDLTYGHSTGLIEDKAAFIEDLVSGKTVFTSVNFYDQTIKMAGNVAIVRHHMVGQTNNNNVPATVDIIVLLIWQKQKGDWKLLARQAAKLPAPAK